MNDRFKFRAWNKLSGEMKDVLSLNINYNFPECSNVILETNSFDNIKTHNNPITCANGIDNVVLMQCTGLKDCKGKLIYEGDIVKYKDEVYGLCIGKIEWDNVHYELQYYTGKEYGWFSHILCLKHIKNIEVIGNIYENKELLNENS